jgi:hypothetical protein
MTKDRCSRSRILGAHRWAAAACHWHGGASRPKEKSAVLNKLGWWNLAVIAGVMAGVVALTHAHAGDAGEMGRIGNLGGTEQVFAFWIERLLIEGGLILALIYGLATVVTGAVAAFRGGWSQRVFATGVICVFGLYASLVAISATVGWV